MEFFFFPNTIQMLKNAAEMTIKKQNSYSNDQLNA